MVNINRRLTALIKEKENYVNMHLNYVNQNLVDSRLTLLELCKPSIFCSFQVRR